MIQSSLYLGYDPKCKLYKREQTKHQVMWYISYYLPNNKRVQRPVHHVEKEAKKLLRLKELQLIQGHFDTKDQKKLEGFLPKVDLRLERLTIEKALHQYFKVTETRKTPKTHYNDYLSISRYFDYFLTNERVFMDEISPLDIQMFIRTLDKSGKSGSTIKNAITMVRKVFNCLIDEIKILDCDNPIPAKIKLPKKNGLVRDRLATEVEIQQILNAGLPKVNHSSNVSPTKQIVSFLIYTGARLSEVLHAEWEDFDLNQGIWHIKSKPKCPTLFGLGWYPKWRKERDVILFQEAIDILSKMPKVKSSGKVAIRNEKGKIIDGKTYPANFIFPKKEVRIMSDGTKKKIFSRVDSIKRSWASMKERAGVSDLQIKDLRTFFNHTLKSHFGFSSKEAGFYIGNSEEVNDLHYTPISTPQIQAKMNLFRLKDVIVKSTG
jgi:integrase